MSAVDDLTAARDAAIAMRLTLLSGNPKPSYNVHGHAISWAEYLRTLNETIDSINKQLAQMDPMEEIGMAI